jgi:hypothetical protein
MEVTTIDGETTCKMTGPAVLRISKEQFDETERRKITGPAVLRINKEQFDETERLYQLSEMNTT